MDSFTLDKSEFHSVRRILSEYASTGLGRALALHVSPSRSPEVVRQWLKQTSEMVASVRDRGLPPFGGLADIRDALRRARPGGGAGGDDFALIAAALEASANVKAYLDSLPEELAELHALASRIAAFNGELKAIRAVVGADGTVLDAASQRLAGIRREIAALTQHIHDVIYGYLRNPQVARLLRSATVTLHGDRYVLPVRAENRGRLAGVVHRTSNTGATVFVEPNESVELNNRLADLREDERGEVNRLLNQLAIRVSGRGDAISATMRTLGQVDLLAAKARYAYEFEMTCPELSERGDVQFHQARHPLLIDQARRQEASGVPPERRQPVVPIDLRLGSDFDLLVITGSNTGGKTVTLKTLALLVLMAQSGMHVPVQRGGRMPVFRDVFLDLGDEQSLEQSLSTFGAHVKRIGYILRKADSASLVLLDELGAGTDPDEGGAIGQAVLDELRRIGCLAMATTHLSVLKAYAYTGGRVDNASVEFDTKTLSPTYRLLIGTPGESHAITVASRLGMSRRLMDSARQHLDKQGKQFRKAIRATGQVRRSAEIARTDAHQAQVAAQGQQEQYEAKLAELHRLQGRLESWMASLSELKSGDPIVVPSMGKAGKLVRLELHRQLAVVDVGAMQVEVPLRELMPDLGQGEIRERIADIRRQILQQASQSRQDRSEAKHLREELQRSLQQQRRRASRFDAWLSAIGRVKLGDEVAISRKPGKGKLVRMDLPNLRAVVATAAGELELPIQDLFPQAGPFARQGPQADRKRSQDRGGKPQPSRKPDRPIARRRADSKEALRNRGAILAAEPGQQVYVVPFQKRATLIRLKEDKSAAVVQSGIFEMEIPIADLEPVQENRG